MKSLKDFDVKSKRILVRCDFNVPLDERGNISNDFRIKQTLPTLMYLISQKAKIILISHLGEPEGKILDYLRLNKVKVRIEELLGICIKKTSDCLGDEVRKNILNLNPGEILLLENVRFYKEETDNNQEFAKSLSKLGDIYINEAFSDCHRNHASIVGIPNYLPHGAGFLLEKEVSTLAQIMQKPVRPMVVIIGGAKAPTKAAFIDSFTAFADLVIVSGLIGQELIAKKTLLEYPEKVLSPKNNLDGLDIGEEDLKRVTEKIMQAKTIFWNGPFGKIEDDEYKKGTLTIAKEIIKSGAFSVIGGGETVEFLQKEGILSDFNHISTGGGAMLEFLSGQELPGLKALE